MSKATPDGWGSIKLGNIFKLLKGSIVPQDNPTERLEYYSIPVFDQTGSSTLVYGAQIESNKTLISEPSILVSKLNPRKPRVQVVKKARQYRQCASTEFMAYAPKVAEVDLSFFRYYFVSEYFSNRLQLVATGSTNSHVRVTPSETLKWRVPHPPLPEQQKIATILSSVDDVIEKTRAQINKLKDLKTGMMQELLTKGIGSGGVPHTEFKDSPVGRIPVGWEVHSLGTICDLQVGYAFKSTWFSDRGIKLLRGDNVGYGTPTWERTRFLSEERIKEFQDYLLNSGDLIIGMDRTFTKSGTKLSKLQHTDSPALLVQRVGRFVPKRIQRDFLWHLLRSTGFTDALKSEEKGMDIPHLSKSEILTPVIALPPTEEQQKIAAALTSIDDAIAAKELELGSTRSLKKALMQDLLTGKVRVNITTDQRESVVA